MSWIIALGTAASAWITARLRPGSRAFRRAKRAVRRTQRERDALQGLQRKARERLEDRARSYARRARDERLGTIPIEELKRFGAEKIRFRALREAGLHTILDLRGKRRSELERIDGIGPVSTQRIVAARRALEKANRKEPVGAPHVGTGTRATRMTIRAARDVLAVRDAVGPTPNELSGLLDEHEDQLARIKKDTGLWNDLLSRWSAKRRTRLDDGIARAHALADEYREGREADTLLANAREVRRGARKELKRKLPKERLDRDHEERFAAYSALIESALPERTLRGYTGERGGLPAEIAGRIEGMALKTELLNATLRGYQEFGAKYLLAQERALLGDEMGLGKTMQALAVLCHLRAEKKGEHFLVVSPASVLVNWQREVERHTQLKAWVMHGKERGEALRSWRTGGGVGISSFKTLQLLLDEATEVAEAAEMQADALRFPSIDALIVDEAHYVKNPDAARTRTLVAVGQPLRHVVYLTGTPIENRLEEFRALVQQLQPPVAARLGSGEGFTGDLTLGRRAFSQAVAPVYLRRNQEDVLRELPERIDNEEWVKLSSAEERAYVEAVRGEDIMAMRRATTIGAFPRESSKLERLEELFEEYREEGRKVLIFSFFLDVLAACEKRFRVHGKITGATAPHERQGLCDGFAAEPGHAILLAQIQAGGVGLNLQAASVVCLLEPQWKPSTEEQAIARAHRMGQTRKVLVHRFFASETVDERTKELLGEKRELFDAFARTSAVKDASPHAVETGMPGEASLTRRLIEAEKERLGTPSGGDSPVEAGKGEDPPAGP